MSEKSSSAAETELCFFAMITNPAGFDQAVSKEIQEQAAFYLPKTADGAPTGQVRVRATTIDGTTTYVETLKVPKAGEGGVSFANTEFNTVISQEYYEAWKATFGQKVVNKIRYVFLSKEVELEAEGQTVTLPEVKYEVDVFLNQDGQPSKWCKIDIEIDGVLAFLKENHPTIGKFDATVKLSSLPINPEHAFAAAGPEQTEEQKAAVKAFWDKFSYPAKGVAQ